LAEAAKHRLASIKILLDRLATVDAEPAVLEKARAAIRRAFQQA